MEGFKSSSCIFFLNFKLINQFYIEFCFDTCIFAAMRTIFFSPLCGRSRGSNDAAAVRQRQWYFEVWPFLWLYSVDTFEMRRMTIVLLFLTNIFYVIQTETDCETILFFFLLESHLVFRALCQLGLVYRAGMILNMTQRHGEVNDFCSMPTHCKR